MKRAVTENTTNLYLNIVNGILYISFVKKGFQMKWHHWFTDSGHVLQPVKKQGDKINELNKSAELSLQFALLA